jgi:hypothetical protein
MADSTAADGINPAATEHLPSFITAPGQTDVLMVIMTVFLVVAVLAFGLLFLRLHTLPERMAHKSQKLQFEIVAVLGLIALFTHMHIFWVIGLILAFIEFPDFGTPLRRIAGSTERMAGIKPGEGAVETAPEIVAPDTKAAAPAASVENGDAPAPTKPEHVAGKRKEHGHV